jgi:hypothetical protein
MMPVEDFLSKVIAQILLSATVRLIEWLGGSEYAQNVVHAIHERCRKHGNWAALQSAVWSLLLAADPSPKVAAGLVWATGYLLMTGFFPVRILARILPTFGLQLPNSTLMMVIETLFVINAAIFLGSFGSRLVIHFANRSSRWGVRLSAAAAALSQLYFVVHTSHSVIAITPLQATATAAIAAGGMVVMIYLGVYQVGRNVQVSDLIADRVFKRWEGPQSAS